MAGLGHGVPYWIGADGPQAEVALRSLREAASGIRRLLDGEEVTEAGEYYTFDGVRLLHPPARPRAALLRRPRPAVAAALR